MKIEILPAAIKDLEHGRDFYARQQEALGDYFLDSLFSDIDSLSLYGGIHAKVFGYHRLLSKRFPYAVYYTAQDDAFVVWRVLDCRQHPTRTARSLDK